MVLGRLAYDAEMLLPHLLALLLVPTALTAPGDWPAFRGPSGDGVATSASAPVRWDREANVRWRVELPRPANGSAIVSSGRVFLTVPQDEGGLERSLYCFDADTGKQLWLRSVKHDEVMPTHKTNPYGGTTPAADGESVVVWHGSAGLACYDFEGEQRWHQVLGEYRHMWGYGTSPVIVGDRVVIYSGPGVGSALFCIDLASGETLWRQDEPDHRDAEAIEQGRIAGSWCTPAVHGSGDDAVLVCAHPTRIAGYRLRDGKELWTCAGVPSTRGDMVYASPVLAGDVAFVHGGYEGPSIGVRLGGAGDVTASHRLWHHPEQMSTCGSGLFHEGILLMPDMGGMLIALDPKTGGRLWRERLARGPSWGSLVRCGGHLYQSMQSGVTVVFRANREGLEVVAENDLEEETNATPALAAGRVYLRTHAALWCLESKPE